MYRPRWGTPGRSTGIGVPDGPGGRCRGDLGRRSPLQLRACRTAIYSGARPGPRPLPEYWAIGPATRCPRSRRPLPPPSPAAAAATWREGAGPLFWAPPSLSPPPPPPRGAIPCVSHPFSLSSFSGHPGQSEPVVTARVAGGGGGGEGDGGGRAGGRGAAQALAALSRAGPSRPGGGRALPGLQPGPGREPSSQQESLAPPASRPPQAHRRATPGADGCPPRTVRICREPGSRDVCELPLVFQAPGAAGRPSGRSCRPNWQ